MSGVTYKLDFLLKVETYTHQIIEQTPDDVSRHTPGRSFYYDIKDLPLRRAWLIGKGRTFMIDLVDGHLEADRHAFFPPKEPPIGSKFRLLYYRQVQHDSISHFQMLKGIRGIFPFLNSQGMSNKPRVRYYFGWTIEGTNKSWEVGLD